MHGITYVYMTPSVMDSDVFLKGFSSFNHLHLLAIIYFLSLAVLLESSISCFILVYFSWFGCLQCIRYLFIIIYLSGSVSNIYDNPNMFGQSFQFASSLPNCQAWVGSYNCIPLFGSCFILVLHWIRLGVRVGCYPWNIVVSLNLYLN